MKINKVKQYIKVNGINVMKLYKVEQYDRVNIVLMLWG